MDRNEMQNGKNLYRSSTVRQPDLVNQEKKIYEPNRDGMEIKTERKLYEERSFRTQNNQKSLLYRQSQIKNCPNCSQSAQMYNQFVSIMIKYQSKFQKATQNQIQSQFKSKQQKITYQQQTQHKILNVVQNQYQQTKNLSQNLQKLKNSFTCHNINKMQQNTNSLRYNTDSPRYYTQTQNNIKQNVININAIPEQNVGKIQTKNLYKNNNLNIYGQRQSQSERMVPPKQEQKKEGSFFDFVKLQFFNNDKQKQEPCKNQKCQNLRRQYEDLKQKYKQVKNQFDNEKESLEKKIRKEIQGKYEEERKSNKILYPQSRQIKGYMPNSYVIKNLFGVQIPQNNQVANNFYKHSFYSNDEKRQERQENTQTIAKLSSQIDQAIRLINNQMIDQKEETIKKYEFQRFDKMQLIPLIGTFIKKYQNLKNQSEIIKKISYILNKFEPFQERQQKMCNIKKLIQNGCKDIPPMESENSKRIISIIQCLLLYYSKVANPQNEEKVEINYNNQIQVMGLKQSYKKLLEQKINLEQKLSKEKALSQEINKEFNKKSGEIYRLTKQLQSLQKELLQYRQNHTQCSSLQKELTERTRAIQNAEIQINKLQKANKQIAEQNQALKAQMIKKAQEFQNQFKLIQERHQVNQNKLNLVNQKLSLAQKQLQKKQEELQKLRMESDQKFARISQLQINFQAIKNDYEGFTKFHQQFMYDILCIMAKSSTISQKIDGLKFQDKDGKVIGNFNQHHILRILEKILCQVQLFSSPSILPSKKQYLIQTIQRKFLQKVIKTQLIFFSSPNHSNQSLVNVVSKQLKNQDQDKGVLFLYHAKNGHFFATVHQNLHENNKGILISLTNQRYFPSINCIQQLREQKNFKNNSSLSIENSMYFVYGKNQLKLKNSNLYDLQLNRNLVGFKCYNLKDQDYTALTGSYYNSIDLRKIQVFKISFQKFSKSKIHENENENERRQQLQINSKIQPNKKPSQYRENRQYRQNM